MLEEDLDFLEEDEPSKAGPYVLKTPRKGGTYKKTIELPIVI